MNYICSYWLSPNAEQSRERELRRYFDLQIYLKKRMGCRQVIVTNIDYPGAIPFDLPPKFTEKFAMFTRFFALAQMVRSGLPFPLCVHDHDFFNAKNLSYDPTAVSVSALVDGYFSDQVVVYPEISKQAILELSDSLWDLDFPASFQSGYGTEVRHEGLYSTEQTFGDLSLQPFKSLPMRRAYNVKDQVSFDIVEQHSLEHGLVEGDEIPAGSHGVHGHINKGPASNQMLDWLAGELSSVD